MAILILPFTFLAKGAESVFSGSLPRWAYIALEITTVAILTVVLAAINWYFDLERFLVGPLPLRKVWLGLVALLGYLCVRLILLVLKCAPRPVEEFPDIAEAISAGCEALTLARIDVRETPLFLVVGTGDESDTALATSPILGETLYGVREEAPVRFYGNHDGIWITIPGVSAVSAQVASVEKFNESVDQTPAGSRLTVEEKELHARRMRYLVQLLRKIRGPVVPFNGVLLAVPYLWICDPEYAQLADTVQGDMKVLQRNAQVKCICQVMFHDIEQAPEFAAYLDRLSDVDRHRRCGCSLPYFTAPAEDDVPALHEWIQTYFERQVFSLYQEQLDHGNNNMLYRLLDTSRLAKRGFRNLLTNAFAVDSRERFYLSGVYFASLTRTSRALFDEIPQKFLEDHDEVIGWNDVAIRRDQRYRKWSSIAAAIVVTILALDVVAVSGMLIGR